MQAATATSELTAQSEVALRLVERMPSLTVGWQATVESGRYRRRLADRLARFKIGAPDRHGSVAESIMTWLRGEPHDFGRLGMRPAAHRAVDATARFEEVPFMSKSALLADLPSFRAPGIPTLWRKTSSGTSGRPVTIGYETGFYLEYAYLVSRKAAEVSGGDVEAAFPIHGLRIVDDPDAPPLLLLDSSGLAGAILRLGVATGDPAANAAMLDFIARERPRAMSSKPAVLAGLVEAVEARGRPVSVPLILSGGAALPAALKVRLARAFGATVSSVYGLTETGVVAFECVEGRYHIDTSSYHVEVVDGEIVVSTLSNAAMPMIRYRTGDAATLCDAPCPCGRAGPQLFELSGRIVPRFHLSDGRRVSATEVFRGLPFSVHGLKEYRVIQETDTVIRVVIDPGIGAAEPERERVRSAVYAFCRNRMPPDMTLRIDLQALTGSDKVQRYQCWLPEQ